MKEIYDRVIKRVYADIYGTDDIGSVSIETIVMTAVNETINHIIELLNKMKRDELEFVDILVNKLEKTEDSKEADKIQSNINETYWKINTIDEIISKLSKEIIG